jgi:3-methyladenine DNA glycosylase AlkC
MKNILEDLEILILQNEDDFDRGSGKFILRNFIKEKQAEQLTLTDVVKSLPTEECVREWYREGIDQELFWQAKPDWNNEQIFTEVYKTLKYFINRWQ